MGIRWSCRPERLNLERSETRWSAERSPPKYASDVSGSVKALSVFLSGQTFASFRDDIFCVELYKLASVGLDQANGNSFAKLVWRRR